MGRTKSTFTKRITITSLYIEPKHKSVQRTEHTVPGSPWPGPCTYLGSCNVTHPAPNIPTQCNSTDVHAFLRLTARHRSAHHTVARPSYSTPGGVRHVTATECPLIDGHMARRVHIHRFVKVQHRFVSPSDRWFVILGCLVASVSH